VYADCESDYSDSHGQTDGQPDNGCANAGTNRFTDDCGAYCKTDGQPDHDHDHDRATNSAPDDCETDSAPYSLRHDAETYSRRDDDKTDQKNDDYYCAADHHHFQPECITDSQAYRVR